MFNFNTHSFKQYFNPNLHETWIPVAKVGLGFVITGLLILLLKEILIAIIAAGVIGIGIYFLVIALRIWQMNRRSPQSWS